MRSTNTGDAPGTSAGGGSSAAYVGEFAQARQTVARNCTTNIEKAAHQLKGNNASGTGNASTERELTLEA